MSTRSPDTGDDYLINKRSVYPSPGTPDAAGPPVGWVQTMAAAIAAVQSEHGDLETTSAGVAAAAVRLLTAVDLAGVSVVGRDRAITTPGATSPVVQVLGQVQHQHRTGPTLAAWTDQVSVVAPDLTVEGRWPGFVAAARDAGICGVLAVPLATRTQTSGVLTLYSRTAEALDDVTVQSALLYAAHAAVAWDAARERVHLHVAIDRRDQIGQAKGILMERCKITDDQAFAVLVRASQHTNTPLRLIVQDLLQSGLLPELGRDVRH